MNNHSQKPLITVILPTYKRPQMLKRAVQSVLNQTYPNFQICIYDNASGDKTAEVVAEMAKKDDRIKYFCQAENIGASKNFNYGMSQVKTPFFAWIADDDIILPDFFEIAMKGLEEHPKAAFFSGTDIIVNEKGKFLSIDSENWDEGMYYPPMGLLDLLEKNIPYWSGSLFRREVVDKIGFFNPDIGASDHNFIVRVARNFLFCVIKKPFYVITVHDKSFSVNIKLSNIQEDSKYSIEPIMQDEDLTDDFKQRFLKIWRLKDKIELKRVCLSNLKRGSPEEAVRAGEAYVKEFGFNCEVNLLIALAKFSTKNRFFKFFIKNLLIAGLKIKNLFRFKNKNYIKTKKLRKELDYIEQLYNSFA